MRPEEKLIMMCRQTGERAEQLLEWLDQSRGMLRAQDRALRIEVQGIANELLALVEAVEQRPTAGVIGGWGSSRAELVGALMAEGVPAAATDENRLSLDRDRVVALLPRDGDGGTAVRIRFVATGRFESPFRFPIQLRLLSQLDLVKILASAYLVHVPPLRQRLPRPEAVAADLAAMAQESVQQTFSGLSRREIDALRDALHALVPESRALRELDAGGYWDILGGLIAHLPEPARRRALSLLWGQDPAVTALFGRLSDAIELLGFSGEVFTGLDAVLGRDPESGWMTRHEESVIATATLRNCRDRADHTIRVASRHGRASDVERFVLAALANEVWLPVDPACLRLLGTADMLIVPATPPVVVWPQRPPETPRAQLGRLALSPAEALELFAAQKTVHQMDDAVRRHTLTSLLVAADVVDREGDCEIDAAATAQIANWIELTQGETPHARERRRTGIAILAAENAGGSVALDPLRHGGTVDTRLAATVQAVLDGKTEWAAEWTPNRPFRNVFSWRPPRAIALPTPSAGHPGSAEILRFERQKSTELAIAAPSASELGASYDLVNLQYAMSQATTTAIHVQQLSARLGDLRRTLTARFLRLHVSSDPSSVVEWRRQTCHVVHNRLQQSALGGGLGRLQRALMFNEGEALAVLARLKVDDRRQAAQQTLDLRASEPGRIVEACLEAWIAAMRQSARSAVLMRAVDVPGHVVAHIADELVIGAVRIGLREKLSEAVRRIQLSTERAVDCENSIAALMARGINAYLEILDPSAHVFRTSVHRDPRFGVSANGIAPAGAGPTGRARADAERAAQTASARPPGPTSASAIAEEWAERFADLIEANILGASLLSGPGHLNRELGDVLAAIVAGPFEGFP